MNKAELLAEALSSYRANHLRLAQSRYLDILDQDPDCAEAAYRLGLIAHRGHFLDQALSYLLKAKEMRPQDPIIQYTLGLIQHDLGRLDDAKTSFENAIRAQPAFAEAYNNLALVLQDLNNLEDSLKVLRQVLRIKPNYTSALNNLGVTLRRLNRLQDAAQVFDSALRLDPVNASVLQNRGRLAMSLADAKVAFACFSRLLEIAPGNAQANYYFATCLEAMQRYPEALDLYGRAETIQPDYIDAVLKAADLLLQMNRTNEAIQFFERAGRIRPGHPKALLGAALTLPVLYLSNSHLSETRQRYEMQLAGLEESLEVPSWMNSAEFIQQIQWTNFFLAYQGKDDLELQRRYGRMIVNTLKQLQSSLREQGYSEESPHKKIRVGFVSRFFRDCTVGHYFSSWITEMDRSSFEINIYYLDAKEDFLTHCLRGASDSFYSLAGDLMEIAEKIRSDKQDVLIYPELGMDSRAFVLAAMRLAAVQCVAWGHPVTTGLPTMDYFFSCSRMEPSGAQDHYSEHLLLIDGLGTHYAPPSIPSPKSRDALGLPENRTLYLCSQSLFKILPDNDDLFARVLKQDPSGTLIFFSLDHKEINRCFLDRLSARLGEHGLDPAGRVIMLPFMSRDDFLRVNMSCDLVLDCLHWSGGNTSLDAIACGLPIVTSRGNFMRGRQTAAMLEIVEVPELIAEDVDDYVSLAGKLAQNKRWRSDISSRISKGSKLLFNQIDPIRNLERHLKSIVVKSSMNGSLPEEHSVKA